MAKSEYLEIKVKIDTSEIATAMAKTALQRVEYLVWCDKHGEVHEAGNINPYDMDEDRCTRDDHRVLYMERDL